MQLNGLPAHVNEALLVGEQANPAAFAVGRLQESNLGRHCLQPWRPGMLSMRSLLLWLFNKSVDQQGSISH